MMQALLVGIREISGKHCDLAESGGYFKLQWSAGLAPEIKLLSETVALSLKRIAEAYPDNLKFSEVHDESV